MNQQKIISYRIYRPWSLLILIFLINKSIAQEADSTHSKKIDLDEVVIKASRTEIKRSKIPSSVYVVQIDQIQGAQATLSLEESLRSVPGVFVNNRFNFSQGDRISIRGIGSRSQFGVRGIKIILDGIPLTFPDGQTQLNTVDLGSLGQIEVLKGSGSLLYGNSSGGIIYLKSEEAPKEKLILTPSFLVGTFGLRKAQFKAGGTLGKLKYLVNTNRTYFQGYRDFSNSLFYTFNSNFDYRINNRSSLSLIINGNSSPFLLNPGSLDKNTAEENPGFSRLPNKLQGSGKKVKQLQTGLNYSWHLNNQKIDITAYGIVRDLYNPIPGRVVELGRETAGVRTTYHKDFITDLFKAGFSIGYDLEYQTDHRKEFENNQIEESVFKTLDEAHIIKNVRKGDLLVHQQESITGNGFFTKADLNSKNWSLSTGVRYDNYLFNVEDQYLQDGSDDSGKENLVQVSPVVGLVYHLKSFANIYSNFSSAFQTPSANEFGNLPSGKGGFNKSLKPEKIRSIDFGVRGKLFDGKVTYDFSAFYMNIYDQLIGYQTAGIDSDEVFYRNAGRTKNFGFEMFTSYKPFKFLSFDLSYTFQNFKFVDYKVENGKDFFQLKNNKVPGIPPHRLFASAKYFSSQGFTAELNLQHAASYYANDFNGPIGEGGKSDYINESFILLDLRASYQKKIK